jgi:hypothetical protein
MRRVIEVARIQTVNWFMVIGLPLTVLAFALLLNLAIFAVLGTTTPEGRTTGALVSLYITMGIAHLQTMTQLFPFAIGMSVTRRAFYAASALVIVVQAVAYGILLVIGTQLETATGGWGLGIRFFALPFLPDGLLPQWLALTVPMIAISAVAVFVGVVFKRWGQVGVYTALIGGAVLLTGFVLLVTWQGWWPAVGAFLGSQPPLAMLAGYPLLVAAVFGGAGWLVLRRATP